jgi:hypothetical protein
MACRAHVANEARRHTLVGQPTHWAQPKIKSSSAM